MTRRVARSRKGHPLDYLIEIVDEVVAKTAFRTATRHDLAVGKAALGFLEASADRVEADLRDQLSEQDMNGLDWLRRTCARYEAMLWQPSPIFLRS